MIDITTVKLPTRFEESEPSTDDSRFQKVKIYIAHTGENLNHSVFSKEVLEKMIPSLSHVPILGYVGVNDDNDVDFRGHEKKISVSNGKFNVSFQTHAYGFIPEENEAHFEIAGGKEWLVTNGYLWTRFTDSIDIFNESNGVKGQSMEIGNAEGYTDERGRVVFTNAIFTGLCILGDDVTPAMTGSTVSTIFTKEDFKSTFEEMLAEFSAEKGEYALATKKKQKDEAAIVKEEDKKPASSSTASEPGKATSSATSSASKPAEKPASDDKKETAKPAPSTPKEDAKSAAKPAPSATPSAAPTDSSATPSGSSAAPTEDKAAAAPSEPAETQAASDEHEDEATMSVEKDDDKGISSPKNESAYVKSKDDKDDDEQSEDDDSDEEKKDKVQFELNLSERESSVSWAVRDKYEDGNDVQGIYPLEVFEDYGIFRFVNWSNDTSKLFRIQYSVNADDSVKLGDKTEIFSVYVTQEEKNKLEADRVKLADLEEQIKELTDYKNGVEMQLKKNALDKARNALTADQVSAIEGQFEKKTTEEITREIAYALYTAHEEEFEAPGRGGVKAMQIQSEKEDYGYGSANELFHK